MKASAPDLSINLSRVEHEGSDRFRIFSPCHAVFHPSHAAGARLAVDSTVATPVHCQPLSLGADIVMHWRHAVDPHSGRCRRRHCRGGVSSRATSLGGVENRASIEGPQSPVPDGLLRLSVGLEAVEDLFDDLEQALAQLS